MTEAEIILVKEALQLVDDALSKLPQTNNPTINVLEHILKGGVKFGEFAISAL